MVAVGRESADKAPAADIALGAGRHVALPQATETLESSLLKGELG